MHEKKTIVVNLLAGPGAAKSTFCASIFAELKWLGVNTEVALEYAKDLVWEESEHILKNQFFVFGNQLQRLWRLNGKVDVIVTDSSLLNSIIYDAKNDSNFRNLILSEYRKFHNVNYFIVRNKPYIQIGRTQNYQEALQLDNKILTMLNIENIEYKKIIGAKENILTIINEIITLLK